MLYLEYSLGLPSNIEGLASQDWVATSTKAQSGCNPLISLFGSARTLPPFSVRLRTNTASTQGCNPSFDAAPDINHFLPPGLSTNPAQTHLATEIAVAPPLAARVAPAAFFH